MLVIPRWHISISTSETSKIKCETLLLSRTLVTVTTCNRISQFILRWTHSYATFMAFLHFYTFCHSSSMIKFGFFTFQLLSLLWLKKAEKSESFCTISWCTCACQTPSWKSGTFLISWPGSEKTYCIGFPTAICGQQTLDSMVLSWSELLFSVSPQCGMSAQAPITPLSCTP